MPKAKKRNGKRQRATWRTPCQTHGSAKGGQHAISKRVGHPNPVATGMELPELSVRKGKREVTL